MVQKIKEHIGTYFVGKDDVVEKVLICLLAGGNVLLEDVPGVGKTTLAQTLAKSIDCDYGRIQFTPDTLPGDVIGMSIYNMKNGTFDYRQGGIMHQIVLADEINRTSPKTQASLLEAMAEGQVTVEDQVYALPEPFMVIATQNPTDYVGTYPLPEAQLDRFMMCLSIGYPEAADEIMLSKHFLEGVDAKTVTSICKTEDILRMKEEVKQVYVSDGMLAYVQEIINATRNEKSFVVGASPRATLNLLRAAQARAYMENREFVKPDDIKALLIPVLHHRISLTAEARIRKGDVQQLLWDIIHQVKIPME